MTAVPSMAMQWGAFPTGMPGYAPGAQFPTWVSGFSRAPNPNILPHPSMHGVTKSSGKTSAHAKAKQPQKDPSKPQFTPDTKAMFLCRVALGRLAVGQPGNRHLRAFAFAWP